MTAAGVDRVAAQPLPTFEPTSSRTFRFLARDLDDDGRVTLRYALDDVQFVEEFLLPAGTRVGVADRARVDGLLALLHWVAGVSYFKTAAPPRVACETGAPPPATAALLQSLYSEGLGEFAFTNRLPALPRPSFPVGSAPARRTAGPPAPLSRVLLPIGGGKDSIVALECARRAGVEVGLFSVGAAPPIVRTADVAGLPHLVALRHLDPGLGALNRAGALNGHVPVTAIVACVALLVAALHGFDAVALSNERSASHGSVRWDGVDVNHQFSKGWRAETLLREALAEVAPDVQLFSLLRPASELAVARAFARLEPFHRRSRAATRSSASTRSCGRRRGAATAPSAASCSSSSRRSWRRSGSRRCSAPTCSTTTPSSRASRS